MSVRRGGPLRFRAADSEQFHYSPSNGARASFFQGVSRAIRFLFVFPFPLLPGCGSFFRRGMPRTRLTRAARNLNNAAVGLGSIGGDRATAKTADVRPPSGSETIGRETVKWSSGWNAAGPCGRPRHRQETRHTERDRTRERERETSDSGHAANGRHPRVNEHLLGTGDGAFHYVNLDDGASFSIYVRVMNEINTSSTMTDDSAS